MRCASDSFRVFQLKQFVLYFSIITLLLCILNRKISKQECNWCTPAWGLLNTQHAPHTVLSSTNRQVNFVLLQSISHYLTPNIGLPASDHHFGHYSVPQYRLTLHLSFICDTIWYSNIRLLCLSSVPLCRDLSLKVTHGVRCPKDRTPLALRLFTEESATARSRLRRGGLHDRRHREGGLWIPFRVRYCILWSTT